MSEETFGPVVGVMKVASDQEAVDLINDSKYGLTASVWTEDDAKFLELVPEIQAGTVFQNRCALQSIVMGMDKIDLFLLCRCDYLDPALAWTGVKDSGRGVSLSTFGYDAVTQLKRFVFFLHRFAS